ncbi:hypothetical protein LCGC14_0538720 [marine sediment metagenome]|uniref:Uncharacterized protein n=1 Tax=marine sediment metagenome TaxID=412755 RepID=A0A0F9SBZ7_9ZZZZ
MAEVYNKGIIGVDLELHVVAKTPKGSMQLTGGDKKPGILKIGSIDLNGNQFSIDGQWFDTDDFVFTKPVAVQMEN